MPTDESSPRKFPFGPGGGNLPNREHTVSSAMFHYSYKDGSNYVLIDSETYDSIELTEAFIGPPARFLKEGLEGIKVMRYEGWVIGITLPPTVELQVVHISRLMNGDIKFLAELETGAKVFVPANVKAGDVIRINTMLGTYASPADSTESK